MRCLTIPSNKLRQAISLAALLPMSAAIAQENEESKTPKISEAYRWKVSFSSYTSKALFRDTVLELRDAAEIGGYERIEEDRQLVDLDLGKLQLHKNVKDFDTSKVSIANCNDCHDTTVKRTGWRWSDGTRFNCWTADGRRDFYII